MKNIIRAVAFGVVSAFALSGCEGDGKDVSGTYFYKNGYGSDVHVTFSSQGGGKYTVNLSSSKGGSKAQVYDWGSAIVDGDFVIRSRDDKKVFEILSDNQIKRLDVAAQPVLNKVSEKG